MTAFLNCKHVNYRAHNLAYPLLYVAVACTTTARADWPQFRGPDGQGHAAASDLPLT